MVVEAWNAVHRVVLLEMRQVARQQHIAHAFEFDQQAVVPGRMAGGVDYNDGAVFKYILVTGQGFELAATR